MGITVHRAGTVFTPQYAVLVNPPDPAAAERLRATGGGARALDWALEGFRDASPGVGGQTVDGLIDTLVQQGLSLETARDLAERARDKGEVSESTHTGALDLPEIIRFRAQDEALSLASAEATGRVRIADMVEGTTPPLRTLYESGYANALRLARASSVELLTNFPVATIAFGFTRGEVTVGQSRLVTFRDRATIRAYGTLNRTEALLFQLDPIAIHAYLMARGHTLQAATSTRDARLSILRNIQIPLATEDHPQPLGGALVKLLHSYSHRLIRTLASVAGIERDSLGEYLLPHLLSVIVYSSARGDFVLGALQAVFEASLDRLLLEFAHGEFRCPLDPGCRSGGGACMACLHVGEPSCRWFNRFLDRSSLAGVDGLLTT